MPVSSISTLKLPACRVRPLRSVGSMLMKQSARTPDSIAATVPMPPCSSPTTYSSTTSPRSPTPASTSVFTAMNAAASPAFMLEAPIP